jgi:hypothetical protein
MLGLRKEMMVVSFEALRSSGSASLSVLFFPLRRFTPSLACGGGGGDGLVGGGGRGWEGGGWEGGLVGGWWRVEEGGDQGKGLGYRDG